MFLFIDTETTGLDPHSDTILEIGLAVTDDDLKMLDFISYVLTMPSIRLPNVSDVVMEMHTKNGLWAECDKSRLSVAQVENRLIEWIEGNNLAGMPLCGSTVEFDRNFIDHQMPQLCDILDFHTGNASAVKLFYDTWCDPDKKRRPPPDRKLHRVKPDIEDSIERLKFYKRELFDRRHR